MLTATIAGRTVAIDGCDTMLHAEKFAAFAASFAPIDQHITVEDGESFLPDDAVLTGSDGMVDWYRLADGGMLYHRQGCFSLTFHADFSRVLLRLRPTLKDYDVLRYLYVSQCIAYHALAHGALGFHAAGIGFARGGGVILAGESATGKTTLTDQLTADDPTITVLSDETLIVTEDDGAYRMHGTPLCGQDRRFAAYSCAVKAIVLLGRGEIDRLYRATPSRAMFGLLATTLRPIYCESLCQTAIDRAATIAQHVKIYCFDHTAGPDAARTLRRALCDEGLII